MQSKITWTNNLTGALDKALDKIVGDLNADRVFVVTDTNLITGCAKLISRFTEKWHAAVITLHAGEANKNLHSAELIWRRLATDGATRRSVVVNFGGGMVSDIGGFCAATFKRGMRFINVPTTLLAMADASVGGKTGIDFMGYKNEIGCFAMPNHVIMTPLPLATLPHREMVSGFAEIVKTAMIADAKLYDEISESEDALEVGFAARCAMRVAKIKEEIVAEDFRESGRRKILNFGHTAGHALEELMLSKETPVSHGEAVAWGMLVALRLSVAYAGLSPEVEENYRRNIYDRIYAPLYPEESSLLLLDENGKSEKNTKSAKKPPFCLKEADVEELLRLMSHDKKNQDSTHIHFVLLEKTGHAIPATPLNPDQIRPVLSYILRQIS